MVWLRIGSFFFLLITVVSNESLYADRFKAAVELGTIKPSDPDVASLRAEIARNLKSTMRYGTLVTPIRLVKYRLKRGENFFTVMAKLSQDADTLSTLNHVANPGAVGPGDLLYLPSARGIFVDGSGIEEVAKRYGTDRSRVVRFENRWFLPGQKLSREEMNLFRGTGFLYPLAFSRISSPYGTRIDPFTHRSTFHGGIDLAAPHGSAVSASRAGRVIRAGWAGGYGNLIVIEHEYGYRTYYGHLSEMAVKKGDTVKRGDRIGRVGSTGRATGPHLHFEVRKNGTTRRPVLIGHAGR